MKVLESQNKEFGFWGTIKVHGKLSARETWVAAFRWMELAAPGWSAEDIRDFLDSTCGRHLADEVTCQGSIENVDPRRWSRTIWDYAEHMNLTAKMPGYHLLAKADAEILKAGEHLRTAQQALRKLIAGLPETENESTVRKAIREDALMKINPLNCYFGE